MDQRTVVTALVCVLIAPSLAFYVPGVHPMDYKQNDSVPLKVGSLISLKSDLPYKYYDLPVCKPPKIKSSGANLGEVLAGDILYNTPYDLRVGVDVECASLCTVDGFDLKGVQFKLFRSLVQQQYRVKLRLDNMPALELPTSGLNDSTAPSDASSSFNLLGYPLGLEQGGQLYVTNHVSFTVHYHPRTVTKYEAYVSGGARPGEGADVFRVVGLHVTAHSSAGGCSDARAEPQKAQGKVAFSYSVKWVKSEQRWATRWDPLLRLSRADTQTHWFSLANSVGVTAFVTLVVALLLLRLLRQDIARYRQLEELILSDAADDGAYEDYGWKVVSGDVFRRPAGYDTLVLLVGSGAQLGATAFVLLLVALPGFFSPARRGSFTTWGVLLYVAAAYVGGYLAAKLHRRFNSSGALTTAAKVALFVPGTALAVFLFIDLFLWGVHSSAAVPFSTVVVLLLLWLGVSLPLALLGGYMAGKQPQDAAPVHTNQIPRGVPEVGIWYHPAVECALAGLVPFAVCFVQLFFVMSRLYLHQFVHIWGFLFPVALITTVAAAEASIITVYLNLRNENYHWWWISFNAPGASGLYVFVFLTFYYITNFPEASASFTHIVVQVGHLFLLAAGLSLVTGAVGFLATLWFMNKIYAAAKPE